MALILVLLLFILAVAVAVIAARQTVDGDWHHRHVHTCGFHTPYTNKKHPCAGCGKQDDKWETKTMRATLIGWESLT